MKERLTSKSLLLTGLNTSDSFPLKYSGRTSFQPIGTVTGIVKLQFSNDNVTFFDLETGLDVSQPFVIETTDYNFYRFVVTTIGTGTVKWSIANSDSDTVSGGGSGASSLTLYGLSTNDYTNAEKSKLAGIQANAEVNVQSDWNETNPSSDAYIQNKPAITPPVSLHSGLTLDDGTNPHGTTKADIGLSNVDNTSDANKPISTATATALSNKADLVGGLVPSSQLPTYIDDVLEFADLASFPATGETGKIYVDLSTNLTYRWSGSTYVKLTDGGVNSFNTRTGAVTSQAGDYTTDQISETSTRVFVTPSEKTAITHSNRSVLDLITEAFTTTLKNAYDSTVTWISTNGANVLSHLSNTSNPHNTTASQVGLGNVDNTSDLDKPTSTATQTQINAINTAFNDFVNVDYVNDLNSKQDSLVSGTNIKTVEGVSLLGSGNLRLLDEARVFLFNDFVSATALNPFVGGAISTGTIAQNTTNFSANTLGVCRITKSTTANSGYRAVTDSNSLRLKGGEVYSVRFCPLIVSTQTFRGGFMDATTVTESVDGVYFQIANSGDLVLKTSNNSVRTTSSVLATLVINTWYKIEVIIGAGATSAYMNLYDATGTLIGSTTPITTNIPTGVGRETGCGFVSTGSSVTADALLDVDFHYFEQTLTR